MFRLILRFVRRPAPMPVAKPTPALSHKLGETLTPNMRALRFALTCADNLLSMGVPSADVTAMALDVTDTYCKRPVHVDISSNMIIISQDRGIDREPLTLMRTIIERDTNYRFVEDLQQLIRRVKYAQISLDDAEKQLDELLQHQQPYPAWLRTIANASVGTGVVMLYSHSWAVVSVTFVIACVIDRLLHGFTRAHVPRFFAQIAAATIITVAAAALTWVGVVGDTVFNNTNPTLIVVGGIVMLVAGLAVFGAIQDAIDEFYVTATARLLRVFLMTAGIVIGILFGLHIATRLGLPITVSDQSLPLGSPPFQLAGAMIIAAGWALYSQAHLRTVIMAGFLGMMAWIISSALIDIGFQQIVTTGIAALAVAFGATIVSRIGRMPSIALISAGVIPLVPGLALYRGLMQLVNNPPGTIHFETSLGTLLSAIGIAIAIAAGVSMGTLIARPLRRKLLHYRNLALSERHDKPRVMAFAKNVIVRSQFDPEGK